MSDRAEILALKADVEVLKRQLAFVLKQSGLSDAEADDLERAEIVAECKRTLNFKPLQEYMKRKIAKRQGASVRSGEFGVGSGEKKAVSA